MQPPLQPEFFAILGINLFIATSLLTCLLDKHLPWMLPYMYQVAALAGFGHLMVSKEFLAVFGDYMRFWYSFIYLLVALTNIVAVNIYLGLVKKQATLSKAFLGVFTIPATIVSAFFVSNYVDVATHPLIMLPAVAPEFVFVAIIAFDTLVVGVGTYIFFKPKWWHIALGVCAMVVGASFYVFIQPIWGSSAFVVCAIALGIACIMVLGASIYVLLRLWWEALNEKRNKRR